MSLLAAETSTSMTSALQNIFDLVPSCISVITGNAVMMTFFCAGVIGLAVGVIKQLKNS
jgi:hypothetical protein